MTYIPSDVIQHVARQIGESPDCLAQYGSRQQTRTAHQQAIELYLGFRSCTAEDLEQLSQWLIERAALLDRARIQTHELELEHHPSADSESAT